MTEHPGTVISIYQVCKIVSQAYVKSFSMENTTSAFRATGLCPLNPVMGFKILKTGSPLNRTYS